MIKAIKPVKNFILVEPTDDQTTSEGGIVLATAEKSKTIQKTVGIIREIGEGVDHVEIGDIVSFVLGASAYEKAEVVNGDKMFILPKENVVGYVL